MPADVLEPPTQTAPQTGTAMLPAQPPSFLDSAEMDNAFSQALARDGKLSPTAPQPTVPAVTEKKTDGTETTDKGTATAKVEEDDTPADIKSPAAKSSWKNLKDSKKAVESERDKLNDTLKRVQSEYEAFKKNSTATVPKLDEIPEYQALKKSFEDKDKELQSYSERLKLLDVERHPQFENYFKAKTEQQLAVAKAVGGDKALELLKLPAGEYRDTQLNELAAELSPLNAARFGAVVTALDAIAVEKQGEIAKARENHERLQTEQKQSAEKQRTEFMQGFERVTQSVTDKANGLAVFQEREGDEAWNKGVQERLSLARHAFEGKLKPEEVFRSIYWAAAAPEFLAQNTALVAKVKALEGQIQELRTATPAPGGGGGEPATTEKYVPGLDGIMQQLEKVLPGAR